MVKIRELLPVDVAIAHWEAQLLVCEEKARPVLRWKIWQLRGRKKLVELL